MASNAILSAPPAPRATLQSLACQGWKSSPAKLKPHSISCQHQTPSSSAEAAEPALIDKAFAALGPGGRIVANAITLDTETAVLAAQRKFGGTLTRLSVERLDAVGGKQAFRPAMTVTQWSATKPRVVMP